MLPSLFAAFNVELLLILSGLFFAFPCRWLVQNREWVDPVVTGPLFILTFFSLVSLNVSDPGILHQGSNELGPMMVPVVWVNHRAFRLQWCPRCCFHHLPRTHHCPWCNICVEVLSLCLFSGAMLVTVLMFPVYRTQLPFSMDEIVANLVAVPAAGFLEPLFVLLLIKARSVSAAERCHEGKDQEGKKLKHQACVKERDLLSKGNQMSRWELELRSISSKGKRKAKAFLETLERHLLTSR
ncbi:palmitoyltransferase ZDHHC19 isoform X1 [Equus caballus]|uniref:palmitoyltransferase ZDHHC19 isoform X1 n=1 Tax=Equus caballus TaxID=9796 RepID=UPI0038B32783